MQQAAKLCKLGAVDADFADFIDVSEINCGANRPIGFAAGQGGAASLLVGTHRGRDYLAAIDRNSHRLDLVQFDQIQNCLKHLNRR